MEEYEDELIEFFSREADNVKDKLCSKRTGKLLPLYLLSSQLCGIRHIPQQSALPDISSRVGFRDPWLRDLGCSYSFSSGQLSEFVARS